MNIKFHPHSIERLLERGATEEEVRVTIEKGEKFAAKFGRVGFRRNFACSGAKGGRECSTKQIETYAVEEDGWLVITVIVKYF